MKHITHLNEIQVSYQRNYPKKKVTSPRAAEEICRLAFSSTGDNLQLRESFFIVLLNRANHVIGYYRLSQGGITGTVADIRLAFSIALKCLSSGMILTHSHPSGNLKPSHADISLTRKFKDVGQLLEIPILDHIILTDEGYYSFADEGLL